MSLKFSELDITGVNAFSSFVGLLKVGDTFTNVRFSAADISDFILQSSRKMITVSEDGESITDTWIANNEVLELITNGQSYLAGVDFIQTGDTIAGLTISFYTGQKILLRK